MIILYKCTQFNAPTTFLSRGFPYMSTWTWSVAIVTSRTYLSTLLHRAVCCSVLQCVAVCCSFSVAIAAFRTCRSTALHRTVYCNEQ